MRSRALWILFLCLPSGAFAADNPHAQVSLLTETKSVKLGKVLAVGIRLVPEKGWHTYWKNPGDSGQATGVQWTLPYGSQALPLSWPAPRRFGRAPVVNFGYGSEAVLLTSVIVPRDYSDPMFKFSAEVRWMECADVCLPQKAVLNVVLPVTETVADPDPSIREIFTRARSRLPVKSADSSISASADKETIQLSVPAALFPGGPAEMVFFPEAQGTIDAGEVQHFQRSGERWVLEIPRAFGSPAAVERLKGVLTVRRASQQAEEQALELDLPVAAKPAKPTLRKRR